MLPWREVFENGPVPDGCKGGAKCIVGIDEAGRGPVLGPLVYGAAFWPEADDEEISRMGFDDSKALTAEQREKLFARIKACGRVGYVLRSLSPEEISCKMLRKVPYNLNAMSHDTAVGLVRHIQSLGVEVTEVFVDTVGDPVRYEDKLTAIFRGVVKFTVRKKADSLYKVVSAASICAKVTRDKEVEGWQFRERHLAAAQRFAAERSEALLADFEEEDEALVGAPFGSGYPGDEVTKRWLAKSFNPVFGFPSFVRFSWSTAKKIIDADGVAVDWGDDDDDAADARQQSITGFFGGAAGAAPPGVLSDSRCDFFKSRGISRVVEF